MLLPAGNSPSGTARTRLPLSSRRIRSAFSRLAANSKRPHLDNSRTVLYSSSWKPVSFSRKIKRARTTASGSGLGPAQNCSGARDRSNNTERLGRIARVLGRIRSPDKLNVEEKDNRDIL